MLTSTDKKKKVSQLRYAEYYNLVEHFDDLYEKSCAGEIFCNLMDIIVSDENIKLAYRNIKNNKGSHTKGTDGKDISDIEGLSVDKFVSIVRKSLQFYRPNAVKRVEIPKPNGKTRPLGIPTILDRIIQQCILQVLEPICEAKFYKYSYGFRPNRSAENALRNCYNRAQLGKLHYVVDIDIKGFFDNVNHSKLCKQLWTLGIRDKKLICIIKAMLKAPIQMPNGDLLYPTKGTPQGGILSPLLSNIVLNELDWWIANQWENFPNLKNAKLYINKKGVINQGAKYRWMRRTNLKEIYIVRYADDFKIFCRNAQIANKIFHATTQWLKERLKLEISREKSHIVNLKREWSEFLGFKFKVHLYRGKYVIISHMSNKAIKAEIKNLKEQIKKIQNPQDVNEEALQLNIYNSMVIGIHNYYKIATHVSKDCDVIHQVIRMSLFNRLGDRLKKEGDCEKGYIRTTYGKSKQMRFINGRPVVPVGYVQHKYPVGIDPLINKFSEKGRQAIHDRLALNVTILHQLMRETVVNRSVEFMDNRISLYCAQNGKCAVTGLQLSLKDIHCHHIVPISKGGKDNYYNLIIIHRLIHIIVHATNPMTIRRNLLEFNDMSCINFDKINKLRKAIGLEIINPKDYLS